MGHTAKTGKGGGRRSREKLSSDQFLLCYIITNRLGFSRTRPHLEVFCYLPASRGARASPLIDIARHARYAPLSRSDTVGAQLSVAEALCEQRGRRLTPIRRKVLELLLRHGRSLKAYELLDAMREVHPARRLRPSIGRWIS